MKIGDEDDIRRIQGHVAVAYGIAAKIAEDWPGDKEFKPGPVSSQIAAIIRKQASAAIAAEIRKEKDRILQSIR